MESRVEHARAASGIIPLRKRVGIRKRVDTDPGLLRGCAPTAPATDSEMAGGEELQAFRLSPAVPDLAAEARAVRWIERHLVLAVRAHDVRSRLADRPVEGGVAADLTALLDPLHLLMQMTTCEQPCTSLAQQCTDARRLGLLDEVYAWGEQLVHELSNADAEWVLSMSRRRLAEEAKLVALAVTHEHRSMSASEPLSRCLEWVLSALSRIASSVAPAPGDLLHTADDAATMPDRVEIVELAESELEPAVFPAERSSGVRLTLPWSDVALLERVEPPDLSGTVAVGALLARARSTLMTGTLELLGSAGTLGQCYLVGGFVGRVRTTASTLHLGAIAYELGLIDGATWNSSLQEVADGRLHGAVLRARGALTRAELAAALEEQIQRKLAHLVAATLGGSVTYRLFEDFDALSSYGGADWPLVDPLPAIWRGIRATPADRCVESLLHRIGKRTCRLNARARVERLSLEPDAAALTQWIDRGYTIEDLLALGPSLTVRPRLIERLLYCLAQVGWLELGYRR